MRLNTRKILLPALGGGIGGALNALLCYVKIPDVGAFEWHIIPAGALHGALLALIPSMMAMLLLRQKLWIRLTGAPVAGYVAGWLSYIPLELSLSTEKKLSILWWVLSQSESRFHIITDPFMIFGFVSLTYYFGLAALKFFKKQSLSAQIILAMSSGILGSLSWWCSMSSFWYISFFHGTIWGILTGFGMWFAQEKNVVRPA